MMQITVVAVGKLKEKYLIRGAAEYSKRLQAYCKLKSVEVKEEPFRQGSSPAELEMVKKKEAERIQQVLPARSYIIALDVQGETRSSEALAALLSELAVKGQSHICFIIGGALGLHSSILASADLRLSFSPMTFPHQLVRLMLVEQIYRAFTIIRGEAYHK